MLILAGDILPIEYLKKGPDSPRHEFAQNLIEMLNHASLEYDHILWVPGNHEYYHGELHKSTEELRAFCHGHWGNVKVLHNDVTEIDGIQFIGGTLWTDFHKGNPVTANVVGSSMNDYRLIKFHSDAYRKLRPNDTLSEHIKTRRFIEQTLKNGLPSVVITHHAPSYQSIHYKYKNDHHMNGGYCSDLSETFYMHDNIKVWTHGHTHTSFDYELFGSRVLANPHGYRNENPEFDPKFIFEV